MAGRKLKLTNDLINELVKLKSAGMTNKAVCDGAGINESTFYDWYNKGEADISANKDTLFSQFSKSYKKAETTHKMKRVKVIQDAASEGNWQAAAWELERCYPSEYGRRTVTEITGKGGEAIHTEVTGKVTVKRDAYEELTADELRGLLEYEKQQHAPD